MAWSTTASPAMVATFGGFLFMRYSIDDGVLRVHGESSTFRTRISNVLSMRFSISTHRMNGSISLISNLILHSVWRGGSGRGRFVQSTADQLEEPAKRFETEQQATRHLVGSQCPDHMLVHCQDVAQTAIERSLLIDRRTACRLVDELDYVNANADDVRTGTGE